MDANQQEMQQKLVLYQILTQRLEQLKEQAVLLERTSLELENTAQTLKDLKAMKQGREVLVPLGSGIYVEGNAGESGKLVVDLGAGVMARKAPAEAGKVITSKRAELERTAKALQDEMEGVASKINELGPELQKFLQELQEHKHHDEPKSEAG